MDDKQRRILERNYFLLVNNIVLSEEFYDCLRRENVIPETMIRDIESKSSREERNERLLDTLQLRGGDSYRKFRHVLYLTGHIFLADHLYGEDSDIKILKGDELFSKFPSAFNTVSDDVKTKLLKYLETKVRERSLTTAWLKSGPERTDLMEARKACYDNEKDFKFKLNTKNKKIQNLRDEVCQMTTELKKRNSEINQLNKDIEEMKLSFKQELSTQTRFNAANNHSVIQLRQRFDSFNERVKILNLTLSEFLEDKDEDIDESNNHKMSTLEHNVTKLLQFARENVENTSSSIMERDAVLRMLKTSSRQKHQPLSEVVKVYIEKQERGKLSLYHELERVLEIVRGKKNIRKSYTTPEQVDLKLLKSQAATLRVEVEHVKKKLDWKENHISDLVQENTNLKTSLNKKPINSVTFPKIASTKSRSSPTKSVGTPDSTAEMEKVYLQFDRYISESGFTSPPPKQSRMRRGSLAEVKLERDFTPPPLPRSKIHGNPRSRIDNVELDILGTGKRTSRDPASELDMFKAGTASKGQNSITFSAVHEESLHEPGNFEQHELANSNLEESTHSRKTASMIYNEGRKPSLADLINEYEISQDLRPVKHSKSPYRGIEVARETK